MTSVATVSINDQLLTCHYMTMNLTITEEITVRTLMNINMLTCIVTVQKA